jgi:hypothetical protein
MDYAAALQVFFQPAPEGTPTPAAVLEGSPARRLRDAIEPLAMHVVWSKPVNERLAEHGLNFLTAYVWGRAAPMGEPVAPLVASAFAAFEPGLITDLYEEGRGKLGRDELLRVQEEATVESLRGILGGAEGAVAEVVTALRRGVEAADGTGRPLFSGVRSLGLPADPFGQLWRLCQAAREYRGDGHIAAYVAAGFDPVQMNILTELWTGWPLGTYSATRAWPQEHTDRALAALRSDGYLDGDRLTAAGHRVRQEIEERTDRLSQPLVDGLGADFERTVDQLNGWAAACIEGGAFPPDIRKRAAG